MTPSRTALCALAAWLISASGTAAQQPVNAPLRGTPPQVTDHLLPKEPMVVPWWDYAIWYQETTGQAIEPEWFGAWVIQPLGDAVYLGFGGDRPAKMDGALVARYDGKELAPVSTLAEQGVHEMAVDGDALYVAGSDPALGDNWDYGNLYVHREGRGLTKLRTLPRGIHMWGIFVDDDGTIFAATCTHDGGEPNRASSQLVKSADHGLSWTTVHDFKGVASGLWGMDVLRWRGRLYYLSSFGHFSGLFSSDDGRSWTTLSESHGNAPLRPRLLVWKDRLLVLDAQIMRRIIAYGADGGETRYFLPGRVDVEPFNVLAVDRESRLYLLAGNSVYRTEDLSAWERVAVADRPLLAVAYWPEKNRLLFSEAGEGGRVWWLDLSP